MGNNNFYIAHNHSRQYCETAWEGSEWRALKKSHHHFLCSPRKKSVEERSFVWFPCPILHRISHDNNSGAVLGFCVWRHVQNMDFHCQLFFIEKKERGKNRLYLCELICEAVGGRGRLILLWKHELTCPHSSPAHHDNE